MELGSHSELDNPSLQVSTVGCPDPVFVALSLPVGTLSSSMLLHVHREDY